MIYLCNDNEKVQSVLESNIGLACIRNTIKLYFFSYGTAFDFAQFYIQESQNSNTYTALILRYNHYVYCVSGSSCDESELSAFLSGFSDVTIVCDRFFQDLSTVAVSCEYCSVMSKSGVTAGVQNSDVAICNEPKLVSTLVCEKMSDNAKIDFFLNTAHQMRHGYLSVYAYMADLLPVSVASIFINNNEGVIPFVYTGEYFRGNGYSQKVLTALCNNPQITYRLLCENHNIKFYEKCGFTQTSTWVKYCL